MSGSHDSGTADVLPWAPPVGARVAVPSFVKVRFPMLRKALQVEKLVPLELSIRTPDGVVGWGGRMQADLARRYARMRKVRYWSLEDGFLRSVGLGKSRHKSLSILVDDLGLHHDPRQPSRLERLIVEGSQSGEIAYAREVRARLIDGGFTKYNCERGSSLKLPAAAKSKRIVLVDQVARDASIAPYGEAAFARMWRDALDQDAEILVRDHPDVIAGFATGALRQIVEASNKTVLDGCGAIDRLLAEVDEVWTVSSQFGFEALLRGKRVVTYGMPFYAGWGLTEDRSTDEASATARERRAQKVASVDELVAAALVRYPVYFDPVEDKCVDLHRALDRLSCWRREAERLSGRYVCVGLSRHKHKTAKLFFTTPWSNVSFASVVLSDRRVTLQPNFVFWGRTDDRDATKPQVTIEDGFIRSVGLGSELVRPRSICIDPVGIYYDATRPSRLENLLNDTAFDAALVRRARALRKSLVELNISKYNVTSERFDVQSLNTVRPVVLVAEQVPDDASLRYGKPVHDSSLALLAAVRKARPDHFILFKRHPDIAAGKRQSRFATSDYRAHADFVLDGKIEIGWAGIAECHSATSQIGFEALLRGVRTYCYGAPFYSGWGLTVDSLAIERRRRTLTVDELVAGALILYPSYRCWKSHLPCEPEDVIRDIVRERDARAPRGSGFSWGRR